MEGKDKGKAPVRANKNGNPSSTSGAASTISFVAFDGSLSDASRKAVRKHAALSSAAARKATIAKKIAKQKEHERRQAGKTKVAARPLQPTSAKRKREPEEPNRPAQSGIPIIHMQPCLPHTEEAADYELPREPQPRIVPAYLSPPRFDGTPNEGLPQWLLQSDFEYRATPYSYSHQTVPLKPKTWTTLSSDYNNKEGYLPPTPESLASPRSLNASFDPFNQYPVAYHPIYDRLLQHMMTVFAPRGWASLKITDAEGLDWEHWMMQQALAEPALFLVRVMFASGDMIRLGVMGENVVVALRGLAIQAINDALADETRSTSDGLILAVGRIAFAESLYGDKHAANAIHRPAQRRMIDLRGGMAALNFSPLVKRLMRLTDRIMTIQGNTARLLPDDEEAGHTTWDMKSTLNVMDDWAPAHEAQAMRTKITIPDLIT